MKNNLKPFDKALIKYQKISLLPLLVTLASFFSSVMLYLFKNPSTVLLLDFVYLAKENTILYFCLSSIFIILGLVCSLFSAKGKIIYFLVFLCFYLLDTIFLAFSYSFYVLPYYIGALLIHVFILLLLSVGIFFYEKAKKELKKETK